MNLGQRIVMPLIADGPSLHIVVAPCSQRSRQKTSEYVLVDLTSEMPSMHLYMSITWFLLVSQTIHRGRKLTCNAFCARSCRSKKATFRALSFAPPTRDSYIWAMDFEGKSLFTQTLMNFIETCLFTWRMTEPNIPCNVHAADSAASLCYYGIIDDSWKACRKVVASRLPLWLCQ